MAGGSSRPSQRRWRVKTLESWELLRGVDARRKAGHDGRGSALSRSGEGALF